MKQRPEQVGGSAKDKAGGRGEAGIERGRVGGRELGEERGKEEEEVEKHVGQTLKFHSVSLPSISVLPLHWCRCRMAVCQFQSSSFEVCVLCLPGSIDVFK